MVTGASRGCAIGAAVVRRLVADGLRVVVHGYDAADVEMYGAPDAGGGAAGLAASLGEACVAVSGDLADPSVPARLVVAARDAFGSLDVVVCAHARSVDMPLAQLTAAELDLTYAVNVRASLLLVQALAAGRRAGPGGRVVLFTSGQHHGAMPGELPYVASKAALAGVTSSLAIALAAQGITVNCIDPGPTDTGYADPARLEEVAAASPSGRWGTASDAARCVAWLAGEEASWVTGQLIASDGGWSVRPRWG